MQMMRWLVPLLGLFLCFSCQVVGVTYDYDQKTDFSSYGSYGYHPDRATGLSELDEKRFFSLLEIALQQKGLRFSEDPDIFIYITSTVLSNPANTSVGVGIGGTGRNVGGGVSVGVPVNTARLRRQMRIDLVDANRGQLIWQAIASQGFKENAAPEIRETQLAEIIDEAFKKYPPQPKK